MKVSVAIITYNHAAFIRQAVEGALMQRTNFDFEILIGEDDSSDGTREIVKEYAAQHPGKIRLFLRDRKDVLHIGGRPTGRRNWVNTIKEASGDYVALLEGDDYWTSPDKLQKQADFLDAHPECSACFHPVQVIYDNGETSDLTYRKVAKNFYTQADILAAGFHIPTCSYFYRNRLFGEFPDWYLTVPVGDLPLHVLVAEHGLLGWMDENMGVYRVHGGGISSGGAKEAS
jgi:glycosyltransferase involved in cell wall biosynthesis